MAVEASTGVALHDSVSSESSTCTGFIAKEIKTKTIKEEEESETCSSPKAKKKRRNGISICLTNCRYDVIRKTAVKFGYKEVCDGERWNMFWTDLSITIERCKEMKRYQKINHFPGMLEISRKDLLARNLNKMLRLFPKDYNFFPRTWCFPADFGDALTYNRIRKNRTFIIKPDAGSQGRGIFITRSLQDVRQGDRCVCQVYINKPYLIDGYKFDLRVYTLVTSCDPLRIYVYDEGLVRFATSKYKEPTGSNVTNVFMHLTNYAVNKYSRTYNQNTESGSKRKLSWFNKYFQSLGYNMEDVWNRINDIIIKTFLSAYPVLKHSYVACFPNHDVIPACCELLGIDIMFDKKLNPHLLEVNHSPSFHTDTVLDQEIKEALISDMFAMLNLEHCDKRKIIREDRKRVRERLLGSSNKDNSPGADTKSLHEYFKQENEKSGGFKLIYPAKGTFHTYNKYFDQGLNSIYNETIASRAREAAQNALKDEREIKLKLEMAKRIAPQVNNKPPVQKKPESATKFSIANTHMDSFEPQVIIEADEKERLQKLAQREHLIRSKGILEHVYFYMKRNGNLRPKEKRKFAIFDKLRNANVSIFMKNNGPTITNFLDNE